MEYRRLGRHGLKISAIGLGCMSFGDPADRPWVLDEERSRPIFKRALELGINFFDTADYYSHGLSEKFLGRAIRDLTDRQSVVIATKVFAPMRRGPNGGGLSRKHIFEAVDESLRRLGTDYIDLYQIHRWDYDTPIEETLEALNDVVRSGRVLYLGASSMFAWQFMKTLGLQTQHAWAPFISMQNHYNLIYREEEREMIPLCLSEGIGLIPWSPLARGFLAGRPASTSSASTLRAQTDELAHLFYGGPQDLAILERVKQVASRLNASPADVSMAWLNAKPGVIAPIIGPTKLEHLDAACRALSLSLSPDDVRDLEALYQPRPVVGQSEIKPTPPKEGNR